MLKVADIKYVTTILKNIDPKIRMTCAVKLRVNVNLRLAS